MGVGNATAGVELVLLAIVDGHPVGIGFGNPIGITRTKGRALSLRRLIRLPKDFTARRLIKLRIWLTPTNRLQQPRDA